MSEFYKKLWAGRFRNGKVRIDYWPISTGEDSEPGINGSIARKKDRPISWLLVTARVDSIDACIRRIVSNGGSIVAPKRAIPGVGYHAHF